MGPRLIQNEIGAVPSVLQMRRRERTVGLGPVSRSSVALFDEHGALQGSTPAFVDNWVLARDDRARRGISDILPDMDAKRWAEVWRSVQSGRVEHFRFGAPATGRELVPAIEVEICQFVGRGENLAKVEVLRVDGASAQLRILQQEIFEAMASGVALPDIMNLMCLRAETLAPTAICSVLSVDSEGRLHHIASPSLPEHYSRAIDGVSSGPKAGSCGTAAYRGEPVVVTEIASDPLWEAYKELALPLGLRACWSSPIKSGNGRVLGAFAFYFPTPRGPSWLERQIVATCLHICAVALEYEETRSRVYDLAFRDTLTNLANRARFQQRVSEALSLIGETRQRLAIHYIGLDQFKSVNEAFGHAVGDGLLQAVAARLHGAASDADSIARIGGDEFAIVQIGDLKAQDMADRASQIIELVGRPYDIDGRSVVVEASVGIALAPEDGTTADELMKNAALALRGGKELGRSAYFFYEKALNARMQARRRLEASLREALAAGEFDLHFQPIVELENLQVIRAEALLRWSQGGRDMIPPTEFIPVAEDTGLIVPLGAWAIEQACKAAASWPEAVSVAVNLSPIQFERPGLVEAVASALAASGLNASRLELEITESVLLQDNAMNLAILDRLSDLGVSIALDDFGTGYSSLSYLQSFGFDRIKIDHSFIKSINRNAGSLKIVRSIVMLAHSLGLMVTAEGVETDEQFAAVRGEGCDDVQGYYMGPPQPLEMFRRSLTGGPGMGRVAGAIP